MSAALNRERVLRAATAAFTLDGYRASIDCTARIVGGFLRMYSRKVSR